MTMLGQDLKYAVRMLLKSPGFTVVAVLTLALGIGANTAIFSVINSVLLRPLPFKDPGRLVQLWETESAPGNYPLTGPDYLAWQSLNRTFDATSLYAWGRDYNASSAGETEPAAVTSTQGNFFSVLGVQPKLGRDFSAGEDQAGRNHVAILSYSFWQRHFGGRPDAIGKSIELNDEAYTLIGVMPSWFNFPSSAVAHTDIWMPMDMSQKTLTKRGWHSYRAIGRMKSGVTVAQARSDLATVAAGLAKLYPDNNAKVAAIVIPLKEGLTGDSRPALLILLGAVALVLLVACANIANLLLARATSRQREIALRAVLGASRWRVVRQLLTESILLALVGAALGLAGAWWCVDLLQSVKTLPIPAVAPVQIDITVLLFTVVVSVLVGVLFGLAPALHASQLNLSEELKSSAHALVSPSGWRRALRDALVVGEIAVSLALLVGAGLLLRSFARMRSADIGVQAKNVVTMGVILPDTKYTTLAARREFYDRLLDRVEHTPGVQAASVSTEIPLDGGTNGYVTVDGDKDPSHANQLVEWNYVTPDYFRTFGIPLLQGANFTPEDVQRTADVNLKIDDLYKQNPNLKSVPSDLTFVAVINRAMAQTYWPNRDAVGKVFNENGIKVTVIGVVGDTKEWDNIRDRIIPEAYYPLTLTLGNPGFGVDLAVRTSVAPMSVLSGIRSDVRELDSSLALFRPQTMDQIVAQSMQDATVETYLLGIFAALAVLLAAVGLYSVMAYLVTQRTHEIGVRMALGAQQSDVLRLVVGHGSKLAGIGIAVGVIAALSLTRLMASLLYGVSATDPLTFAGVAILLAAIALAACIVPVLRATRIEPMDALRYE